MRISTFMKNYSNYFLKVLSSLRKERGAHFLFMPNNCPFRDICLLFYFEFISPKKGDVFLIGIVLDNLKKEGLLTDDYLTRYTYKLDTQTLYFVRLKSVDGSSFSNGISNQEDEAYAKAIGELLERSFLRFNHDKKVIQRSQRSLISEGKSCIDLNLFPKPTKEQIEYFQESSYNEDDIFSWLQVKNIRTGKMVHAPAQTIFIRNAYSYPKEKIITESNSHGAGAFFSENKAVNSGLFEVLNRHFFLKGWYENKSPCVVDIQSIPHTTKVAKLITDLIRRNFKVLFLDYSEEAGVPSVICFLEKDGGVSCGGSAGLRMEDALERSLLEAFSVYVWSVEITLTGKNNFSSESVKSVKDFFIDNINGTAFNRVLMYHHEYFVRNINFYKTAADGRKVAFSDRYDKSADFNFFNHMLNIFGDIYYYKAENAILNSFAYSSVKVIVPGSFFFALNEANSRPVREGVYPQNGEINPFP